MTSYTFRAIDADGATILQARGRAGALAKVLEALRGYRAAVAAGSGRLYGNPATLGSYSVDGVMRALGATCYISSPREEIERLDRLGLERVVQITRACDAEAAAA